MIPLGIWPCEAYGWLLEVGLSNERYVAADGQLYEGSGIPPQVEVAVWVEGDLRRGYRRAVDEALRLVPSGPRVGC